MPPLFTFNLRFLINLGISCFPNFDHDTFMHQDLHVLDASA